MKTPTDNRAILILDTMIQPNPVASGEIPNVIKPGKYRFELLLSGDNVKTLRKIWGLEFDKWSDDEGEMLNNHIKIKELKS
jgi:ABC-type phosphate transport system substrate-binding protein